MTAVTKQSNKMVSNEVKDNEALLEPYYGGESKWTFWPTQFLKHTILLTDVTPIYLIIKLKKKKTDCDPRPVLAR